MCSGFGVANQPTTDLGAGAQLNSSFPMPKPASNSTIACLKQQPPNVYS
jgi:hypothetical protein